MAGPSASGRRARPGPMGSSFGSSSLVAAPFARPQVDFTGEPPAGVPPLRGSGRLRHDAWEARLGLSHEESRVPAILMVAIHGRSPDIALAGDERKARPEIDRHRQPTRCAVGDPRPALCL